jgi:hypothetical protein
VFRRVDSASGSAAAGSGALPARNPKQINAASRFTGFECNKLASGRTRDFSGSDLEGSYQSCSEGRASARPILLLGALAKETIA